MSIMWILLAIQLLGILNSGHSATVARLHCGPGEFLKNGASCEPCPDGTYMDQLSHTNIECIYCQRGLHFNHEVELEKCTKTKDTVIGCSKDHYMNRNTGDRTRGYCYRCQKCGVSRMKDLPYVVQKCTSSEDTVCGAVSPVYCGEGQFVSRNLKTGQEFCADCPEGTFMTEARHQNIECRKCSRGFSFNHQVEIENCTKTKDTVIRCTKDYYMERNAAIRTPGYCSRCQKCGVSRMKDLPYVVENCAGFKDTVCGSVSLVYCGEGQFVSRNLKTGQEFCTDCPEGTFMTEARHQKIECRPCSRGFSFNREVEVKKCTKTADTSILCDRNFYRVEASHIIPGYCQRCTDCGLKPGRPVEIQPCGKYTDTVCG